MIWANNSEFFLSNFYALKPRIIILGPKIGSTPNISDISHDWNYQIIS